MLEVILVVSVLALLSTLVLVTAATVKQSARGASCKATLRTIGLAVDAFTSEREGFIPAPIVDWGQARWADQLAPYLDSKPPKCPAWIDSPYRSYWDGRSDALWPQEWDNGYGMIVAIVDDGQWNLSGANWNSLTNEASILRSQVRYPVERTYLADSGPWWLWPRWLEADERFFEGDNVRHRRLANSLYFDGHVGGSTRAELLKSIESPGVNPE